MSDSHLELRHALATLAYRAGKTLRAAAPEVPNFRVAPYSRSPVEILAHMGDLLDCALRLADGRREFHESTPLSWDAEIARFFTAIEAFDQRLAQNAPLGHPPEKIFQGPLADALTHTGQIAMLRRLAGSPVRGENYFMADICTGRVGPDQSAPRREFD